jgi:ABC-2 type transport system permease protein
MRALLIEHIFRADLMWWALGLNSFWFGAGVLGFLLLLDAARRHGALMQTGE